MKKAQVENPNPQDCDFFVPGAAGDNFAEGKTASPPAEAVETTEVKAAEAERPVLTARPVAAAKSAEPTFTVAQLRPSARKLFGISQSTYDGATDGIGPEEQFTVGAFPFRKEDIRRWKDGF